MHHGGRVDSECQLGNVTVRSDTCTELVKLIQGDTFIQASSSMSGTTRIWWNNYYRHFLFKTSAKHGMDLKSHTYWPKQAIWLDDSLFYLLTSKQILFCSVKYVSSLKLSKYDLNLLQNMNLSLNILVNWA